MEQLNLVILNWADILCCFQYHVSFYQHESALVKYGLIQIKNEKIFEFYTKTFDASVFR